MTPLSYPAPPLQDDAVLLRPWGQEDLGAIVAGCQHPSVSRFSPVIPFPYTERDALEWLECQEPMRLSGAALDLAVTSPETAAVLGGIGIGGVNPMLRSASIGYWLAYEERGHGYMSRAVRLLAGWAFDVLALARLELTTDPKNLESQRVAERCGFTREGRLRSHMLVRHSGERRDSLIYGLLPGELR